MRANGNGLDMGLRQTILALRKHIWRSFVWLAVNQWLMVLA